MRGLRAGHLLCGGLRFLRSLCSGDFRSRFQFDQLLCVRSRLRLGDGRRVMHALYVRNVLGHEWVGVLRVRCRNLRRLFGFDGLRGLCRGHLVDCGLFVLLRLRAGNFLGSGVSSLLALLGRHLCGGVECDRLSAVRGGLERAVRIRFVRPVHGWHLRGDRRSVELLNVRSRNVRPLVRRDGVSGLPGRLDLFVRILELRQLRPRDLRGDHGCAAVPELCAGDLLERCGGAQLRFLRPGNCGPRRRRGELPGVCRRHVCE